MAACASATGETDASNQPSVDVVPPPSPERAVIDVDQHAALSEQPYSSDASNHNNSDTTSPRIPMTEMHATATATAPMEEDEEEEDVVAVVEDEPELRAVVVEQPGYHLYRTPSTYAYSSETLPSGMSFEQYTVRENNEPVAVASSSTATTVMYAATTTATDIGTVTAVDEEEKEEIVSNEYASASSAAHHATTSHSSSHNNDHGWVASATQCAIPVDPHEEYDHKEHDALAGMPTYAVGTVAATEPATVLASHTAASAAAASSPSSCAAAAAAFDDQDDDSELTALKRAAAYGGGSGRHKPEPRASETLDRFYERTCEFWNALAMDALAAAGGDIDIERVMDDSMTLAREQYTMVVGGGVAAASATVAQEATVVEIAEEFVHPSELLEEHGAVRAEFVGQQQQQQGDHSSEMGEHSGGMYSDATAAQHVGHTATAVATAAATSSPSAAATAHATQVHDGLFEQTAEATVLDSAPVDKLEGQIAWQNTEEAQVLQPHGHEAMAGGGSEVEDHDSPLDRKPPAVDYSSTNHQHQQQHEEEGFVGQDDGGFAVAEQEGEVVQVVENVHPAEYGEDTEAEVVGTEYTATAEAIHEFPTATAAATTTSAAATAVEATSSEDVCSSPEPVSRTAEVVASPMPEPAGFESNERNSSDEVRAVAIEDGAVGVENSIDTEAIPVAASIMESSAMEAPRSATKVASDEGYDFTETHHVFPPQDAEPPEPEPPSGEGATDTQPQTEEDGEVPEWLQTSPERQELEETDRLASTTSSNTSQRSQLQYVSERASQMTSHIARSSGTLMEHLFGETRAPIGGRGRGRANTNDVAQSIVPRNLLPWSVIHSTSNDTWVATLQTNQKALDSKNVREASKSLRAFSLPTETQAVCLAKSWTPPRMLPFADNQNCHICKTKFAVFRRPCHCRNCGVCVCKDCAVQWPNKMIPETYNVKKESTINACKACEWLCNAFRDALLEGNTDKAVAVHATGNVNLTSPFANVKGEEFYPVHAAVLGGNLKLLKWLVDDNCCPIKSVRVSGKTKELSGRYTPIVTSKGRSLLGIAMENESVDIVRYLVVKKGISIAGEKDVTPGLLIKNLDKVLRLMPDTTEPNSGNRAPEQAPFFVAEDYEAPPPVVPSAPIFPDSPNPRSLSEEARDFGAIDMRSDGGTEEEGELNGANKDHVHGDDECIICFDRLIDCVATPCGHQMCCLECSNNISRCPVCAQDCSFLRVFKP